MTSQSTPVYKSMTEIFGSYCIPNRLIMFEGRMYKYKGIKFEGDTKIHSYRCDSERHNLVIYTHEGRVFYVDAFYSVDEVMAHEASHAIQAV